MNTYKSRDKKATRDGFGDGLLEAARQDARVTALCADLTGSVKATKFAKEFPERFFQAGIAEANMMGVAAGLATGGKIPFASTFANFGSGRVYDQIRQSIAYSNKNVKICVSHAGITLGEDGASHQIMEDIGLMKGLPNMTVINTCDYTQTRQATMALIDHQGPAYLRFGRPKVPDFIPEEIPFKIGKAIKLIEGKDVSLIATGHLVWTALEAQQQLKEQGISAEVINMHTIKPLDEDAIKESVEKTGCVVTAEEHLMNGGLGDSVAQTLIQNLPVPMEMVAVKDTFGESGKPDDLLKKYGLSDTDIVNAVSKVLQRKA